MSATEIAIPLEGAILGGELDIPANALGLVLFAHGSGSSRHSPRNQLVAKVLRDARAEAATRHLRFNIRFLAQRLIAATRWALAEAASANLPVGYFGASTGAAAALVAGAELGELVHAIVSRGGRPDLAGEALERVAAPTLLIVGGEDRAVIGLNETAYRRLHCEKALRIILRATHLFEEPGALEQVARMASAWFADHLQPLAKEGAG